MASLSPVVWSLISVAVTFLFDALVIVQHRFSVYTAITLCGIFAPIPFVVGTQAGIVATESSKGLSYSPQDKHDIGLISAASLLSMLGLGWLLVKSRHMSVLSSLGFLLLVGVVQTFFNVVLNVV